MDVSAYKVKKTMITSYDGQTIFINGVPAYEIGNYLGRGASGMYVYHIVYLHSACFSSLFAPSPLSFIVVDVELFLISFHILVVFFIICHRWFMNDSSMYMYMMH